MSEVTTKTRNLNDEAERQNLKVMIDQVVAAMHRKVDEQEQIKEIVTQIKTLYGLKPKVVNSLCKAAYKCDFNEQRSEIEQFVELYESVMVS